MEPNESNASDELFDPSELVDPGAEPLPDMPYIVDTMGERRVLGAIQPTRAQRAMYSALPKFADNFPDIDESKWQEIDFENYEVPIENQSNQGSCVGHATWGAFTNSYKIGGGTIPEGGFSTTSVYAMGNGGRDQGMNIGVALQIMMSAGICLRKDCPPLQIWLSRIPAAAIETAKRFRIVSAYTYANPREIFVGLQYGIIPVVGTYVSSNWNNLDDDGCPPAYPNYYQNHALYSRGMKLAKDRKTWLAKIANSWSTSWGINGQCFFRSANLAAPRGTFEAWGIRAITEDVGDPNTPPKPIAV